MAEKRHTQMGGEPPPESKTDSLCAKCGACSSVCPVFLATGRESLTARGRLHLSERIEKGNLSRDYRDIFSKCLLCGACRRTCPRDIDIPAMVIETRSRFSEKSGRGKLYRAMIEKCLASGSIMAGLGQVLKVSESILAKLPLDSGLRLKLGLPLSADPAISPNPSAIRSEDTVTSGAMLFTGCFAAHLERSITEATIALISGETAPPILPPNQNCCGLAFHSSGDPEKARHLARQNIMAFETSDKPIIVFCGSCFKHLGGYPALLADDQEWRDRAQAFADRLRELSLFLNGQQTSPNIRQQSETVNRKIRVFYHDPCHLRNSPELRESPRKLLGKLPWLDLVEPPGAPNCCGFGGLFSLAHPDLSRSIAKRLTDDIMAVSPDLVVTSCSGCLIQLRRHLGQIDDKIGVEHLSRVLAKKITCQF